MEYGWIFDSAVSIDWNNSDTVIIVALVAFCVLGLLLGAKKLFAKIVGQFVAVIGSLALANIVLPYLTPMEWYQKIVTTLWNNAALVNWVFYILLSGAFYGAIMLIWKLVIDRLIEGMKETPILSRIFGVLIGAADWAILLIAAVFLFSALPNWLGSNTPSWVTGVNTSLSTSVFAGKLTALFNQLINLLGASPKVNP